MSEVRFSGEEGWVMLSSYPTGAGIYRITDSAGREVMRLYTTITIPSIEANPDGRRHRFTWCFVPERSMDPVPYVRKVLGVN